MSRALAWDDVAVALGCALAALVVYVLCLPPTVTGDDSGELIVAAYTLGIPHPPGYPLWTLLAHTFTWLPWGTVAWRVALASAVLAAAAVAVFALIASRLTRSRTAAAAAGLAAAFSARFWEQAVIAEVYALNALVIGLCLLLLILWRERPRDGLLYAFALSFGLGLCNHNTVLLLGPVFAGWILAVDPDRRAHAWTYVKCIAIALVPLLLYLHLPIRSAADPPMDWGDPETWDRFWDVVTRRQYSFAWAAQERGAERLAAQVWLYVITLAGNFAYVLLPLGVIGAVASWRRTPHVCALLGAVWAVTGLGFVVLLNTDPSREIGRWTDAVFWIPSFLVVAVWLGAGVEWVGVRLMPHRIVSAALTASVAVVLLGAHWSANDKSSYWFADDYGRNVFASMEPGALYFTRADHGTFPLLYLQVVEGLRTDVVIADRYGYPERALWRDMPAAARPEVVRRPWTARREIEDWVITNTHRPVYVLERRELPMPGRLVGAGLVHRVVREGEEWTAPDLWSRYEWHSVSPADVHGDLTAAMIVSDYHYRLGRDQIAAGRLADGLASFDRAIAASGENPGDLTNFGSTCYELGYLDEAAGFYERALVLDPTFVPALTSALSLAIDRNACGRIVRYVERLSAVTSIDIEQGLAAARCHLENGHDDEAAIVLRAILEAVPGNDEARRLLGNATRR